MKFGVIGGWVLLSCLGLVVGCESAPVGADGEQGASVSSPLGAPAPCENAELHSRMTYEDCVDGFVSEMESKLWCCPDGTQKTTEGVLSKTSETCNRAASGSPIAQLEEPPPPTTPCTIVGFPEQPVVEGGVLAQSFTSSPSGCTVSVTATPPAGGRCTIANPEKIQANVSCNNMPATGTITYAWTCSSCPDGSPNGSGTTTGTW